MYASSNHKALFDMSGYEIPYGISVEVKNVNDRTTKLFITGSSSTSQAEAVENVKEFLRDLVEYAERHDP